MSKRRISDIGIKDVNTCCSPLCDNGPQAIMHICGPLSHNDEEQPSINLEVISRYSRFFGERNPDVHTNMFMYKCGPWIESPISCKHNRSIIIERHFAEDRNRIRAQQIVTFVSASLAFLLRYRLLKGRNRHLRLVLYDRGQREISQFVFTFFLTCYSCVNV
jgi:hypothetical protein